MKGKDPSMKLPSFISDLSLPPVEYHQQLRQWAKEVRENEPILWDDESNSWLVSRYDDVVRVQNDYHTFSSENTVIERETPQQQQKRNPSILEMDPPVHRQMRSLVTQAFSARTIAGLAPQIEETVDGLLEAIGQRNECDWMADLANPLPVIVIARMLGLPTEEWPKFKGWTDQIINEAPGMREASEGFSGYFKAAIQKRMQEPGSDILSLLITSEVDGQKLSFEEVLSFCFTLFIAGNITTTNVLGNSMLCFNSHPEEMERLRQNPELITTAIEEVIRYMSPFRGGPNGLLRGRLVKSDVDLRGQLVKQGDFVQMNRIGANFDERQFADPERFDVGRDPNRHQSFGHGAHFCLGAPLARLEIRVVLEKITQRFQTLRIVPGVQLEQTPSSLVFGVKSVPIEFTVA